MFEQGEITKTAPRFFSNAFAVGALLVVLATIACSRDTGSEAEPAAKTPTPPHSTADATPTPVSSALTPPWELRPYYPMFTLTPFAPTATPAIRPIPPLPDETKVGAPQVLPDWIKAVSPAPGDRLSLSTFNGICIAPAKGTMEEYAPALKLAFQAGERARDHLYLRVNGIVPSELTWQEIVIPNSTHPGTAWVGTRTYREFCWIADITVGLYEVVLFFPTETESSSFTWQFTTIHD